MNEKIKKVFDILGVEPNERFKIKYRKNNQICNAIYFIKEDLNIYAETKTTERLTDLKIRDLLIEHYEIIKLPKVTEKEQLAIDYARACGCNWIAKDSNGTIFGYHDKPKKSMSDDSYHNDVWDYGGQNIKIAIPIAFLSWADEEPYYIGDQ